MPITLHAVAAGREACTAIADAVQRAQSVDPLAPVVVVVPGSYVGLVVRRFLAGRPGGIANVRTATVTRLAGDLAAAELADEGRIPLTDAALRASLRRGLAAEPGVFAEHRDHPATLEALVSAWHDLRGTNPATRRTLAAGSLRAGSVVALIEHAERLLSSTADDLDLLRAARRRLEIDPARGHDLGAVVVHLPTEPPAPQRDLLRSLASTTDTQVVVSLLGDPQLDEPLLGVARSIGAAAPDGRPHTAVTPPTGTRARSAPSPDTEVLACVRDVMARADSGVAFHRMGIASTVSTPYHSLLQEQLVLAGVPVTGVSGHTLAQTAAGRLLLGALEIPGHDWARDAVIGWLAGAPVRHDGRAVPATAWDRCSCAAGIVGGRDEWVRRLDVQLRQLDHELRRRSDGQVAAQPRHAPSSSSLRSARAATAGLASFTDRLADRLDALGRLHRWDELATGAGSLLRDLGGGPGSELDWPEAEQEALRAVQVCLDQLGGLDEVEPRPDLTHFLAALRAELHQRAPQTGRFGSGVIVGSVATLAGLDLDVVWVLGMHDGALPAPPRRDTLLSDDERVAAGAARSTGATSTLEQRRAYLQALAAAPERICSFSRGELRRGRAQRPARWLLDTIGALAGRDATLWARDLDDLGAVTGFDVIASHAAEVRRPGPAADLDDARLGGLARWVETGHELGAHWLTRHDDRLCRALDTVAERVGPTLSRFEGVLDPVTLGDAHSHLLELPMSPTRLETYATCGRRYLFARVLELDAPDRPEDIIEMAELQRGRLVHEVLERFTRAELAHDPVIEPDRAWDTAAHARLDAVAHQVFDEFERRGVTGHPHLWQLDRRAVLRNLHHVLEVDDTFRADHRSTPAAAELGFGDDTAVVVSTPSGRSLPMHGSIDRVDRTASGGAVVVDYKHGNRANYRMNDGIANGRHLQLPVYGAAVRQIRETDDVEVGYWVTRTPLRAPELRALAPLLDEASAAIDVLVDHIDAAAFPARPGADGWRGHEHCRYCAFDVACPANRAEEWERARAAPPLASLVALVEPDDATESGHG